MLRRLLLIVPLTLLALIAWTAGVGFAAFNGWTRTPIAPRGDSDAFLSAISAKLDRENPGDGVIALVESGRITGLHVQARGGRLDGDSLFQIASLSKWVTAWGVLHLADEGRIDLDAPISRYVKRWSLPASPYNDEVTIRRLLSHSAGFTDDLGYRGFAPGETPQTLEQSLTQASDAMPGRDGRVRVGVRPGGEWRYSGGGYTLLQLMIEDVTGEPFNAYMRRAMLAPLGMTGSTFVLDDATRPHVAPFFGEDGHAATHYTFTALAAASLYTSANDLARFLAAQCAGPNGEAPGRGVLKPETLRMMRQTASRKFGFPIWGLGLVRYAPTASGDVIIGHEGGNYPAINTTARVDPSTCDGFIALETGSVTEASTLGDEWVIWRNTRIGLPVFADSLKAYLPPFFVGWAFILIGALAALFLWRPRRA